MATTWAGSWFSLRTVISTDLRVANIIPFMEDSVMVRRFRAEQPKKVLQATSTL